MLDPRLKRRIETAPLRRRRIQQECRRRPDFAAKSKTLQRAEGYDEGGRGDATRRVDPVSASPVMATPISDKERIIAGAASLIT